MCGLGFRERPGEAGVNMKEAGNSQGSIGLSCSDS